MLEKDTLYDVAHANEDIPDLKCISINLSVELVLQAYPMGLFPWHQDEQYFYWFSPNPRMVLFPHKVKVSKSMRNVINQKKFRITENETFNQVIEHCAKTKRKAQEDTWISEEFKEVYTELHQLGFAKSVEAWNEKDELVGGLYGLELGKVFFGESMFSKESNASKVCFIHLAKRLEQSDFKCLDCQAVNAHLKSLGAEEISVHDFLTILSENL